MILFISNSWSCFFRQKFVIPTFGSSVNFIFVLFQVHSNRGVRGWYPIYIMEWKSNSSYPCIKYDHFLYLQRSNGLWCPTLVLLSQIRILLFLPGSNGYDINCWFQVKMIINIRNVLFLFGLFAPKAGELKPKKNLLARANEQIYISFRKFSKRTNLGWLF